MTATETAPVLVEAHGKVPEGAKDLAAEKVAVLLRLAPELVLSIRVVLAVPPDPAPGFPAIAKATADLCGRIIRAQAVGREMTAAIDQMEARLRVRLQWAARHRAAIRGGSFAGQHGDLRHLSIPARRLPDGPCGIEERTVIGHASYAARPETPAEAAAELDLLDYDFHLFTERSTGQDASIHRTNGGYGLTMPIPGLTRLGPVPGPVTFSKLAVPPLTSLQATIRLDAMGQPFTFFTSSRTGRGCIMYYRYDGHYGLIFPAGTDRPATRPAE